MHLRKKLHEHVIDLRAFFHQRKSAFTAQPFRFRGKLAAHVERAEVRVKRFRFCAGGRSACEARAQLHERRHQRGTRPLCRRWHLTPRKGGG